MQACSGICLIALISSLNSASGEIFVWAAYCSDFGHIVQCVASSFNGRRSVHQNKPLFSSGAQQRVCPIKNFRPGRKRGGCVCAGRRNSKITNTNVERVVAYLPLSNLEGVYLCSAVHCDGEKQSLKKRKEKLVMFFSLPFRFPCFESNFSNFARKVKRLFMFS